jgi:hypothetical protein
MMFYFIVGFCAILLTISLMEYLNAKKRLVDQQIEEVVARKLKNHQNDQTIEILNLREACGVMRNLLMDIAENEASLDGITNRTPDQVRKQLVSNHNMRRTELRAEVDAVLRSSTDLVRADASI